ncbi:MAG TPA: hypothetical protein VHZ55_10715 [Bryobacteraceae bacterium]|jgi:hypothetical protein|nr:hypothetical protein [Bryobacteraceae bacterium]
MTIESFIRYGSLWTLILGVLSLGFAVRSYRRQTNTQIFFEIAGRYHGMLQSLPIHAWTRLNPKDQLPESTAELTAGVLRYLAIVHYAFILRDLRYLSKDLWKILQAEHHRTLATRLFVREWGNLRIEFDLFPEFLRYVDSIQHGPGGLNRDPVTVPGIIAGRFWRSSKRTPTQRDRGGSSDSEFPG